MQLDNPYATTGTRWLRGEIHAHVKCALDSTHTFKNGAHPASIYREASEADLDFVCMSVEVSRRRGGEALFGDVLTGRKHEVTGIPAREIQNNYFSDYFHDPRAKYLHVLTLGEVDGLSLCVHPMYYETASYREGGSWRNISSALSNPIPGGHLEALKVRGLEIYNAFSFMRFKKQGRLTRYEGYEEACWDDVLMKGLRYWGFAGNDSYYSHSYKFRHIPYLGVVYADVPDGHAAGDILCALKEGRFYSSTGVRLAPTPLVAIIDRRILRIRVAATTTVTWTCAVYRGGEELERKLETHRMEADFEIEGDWRYVRISCVDSGDRWRRAWLQPIFRGKS